MAIGFAIAKGYDRIVVFKADPSALDGDRLQSIGRGCYLYQGDIRTPKLVNRYRSPSSGLTEMCDNWGYDRLHKLSSINPIENRGDRYEGQR